MSTKQQPPTWATALACCIGIPLGQAIYHFAIKPWLFP